MEIIADTVYNSAFADSDMDVEKANVLQELEVSFATTLCKFIFTVIIFVCIIGIVILFNH